MKLKRILSAVLALSLAGTMAVSLTGCGNGKDANTLTWYMFGDKPADLALVLEKANEIIEPAIGMKLDMQYIDSASYQEKMKLKMAAGESYDLAFTGYCNDYQAAVELGGLYDITEFVEEVNLKEVIPEFYLDAAKVEGKIYGVPNIQVISNPITIHTGKEWADELGIDMKAIENAAQNAKNVDDVKKYAALLDDALTKLHNAHPDMYTFNPNWNIFGDNYYEELVGGVGMKMDGSETKLVKLQATDIFRFGAEQMHEWYKKGFIRNDISSVGTTVSNKEEAQRYLTTTTTWKPGQEASDIERYNYTPAYAQLMKPYVKRTAALSTMISVSANTKHPKEAVQFIKLINENKELFNILVWGIEGEHYTKDESGKVTEIEDSGYTGIGANAWKYGNQFNAYLKVTQPDGVWEATEEMNNTAMLSPMLGFVPDTSKISSEIANVQTVQSEYQAKRWGVEDPANWYDEFLAKLEQAGIDKILTELQAQYDAFLAAK